MKHELKSVALQIVPGPLREPVRNLYRRLRWGHLTTEQVFERVYRGCWWGRDPASQYYSGEGTDPRVTAPYVETVAGLLKARGVESVVDLGCGDFRVGRLLTEALPRVRYIGVDVVRALIEQNNASFGSPIVRFVHLDVTRDELPDAEACLVRQVFQHLSNAQIARCIDKLTRYRFVAITESHPLRLTRKPNADKPAGPSVRHQGYEGSGVYLEAPPFNLPISTVLTVKKEHSRFPELLTTYWLEHDTDARS